MDQSFELLSSMSPKAVMKKKPIKKGASILALKKNLRRSSLFNSFSRPHNNEPLNIIESVSSENVRDSVRSSESGPKTSNLDPIVISDTDECSEDSFHSVDGNDDSPAPSEPILLSSNKIDEIQRWISDLPMHNGIDTTAFSEVSAIFGDSRSTKFKPKEEGNAINSTFLDPFCYKRFDECFGSKQKYINTSLSNNNTFKNQSVKKNVIEDSFEDDKFVKCNRTSDRSTSDSNEIKKSCRDKYSYEYKNIDKPIKKLVIEESLVEKVNALAMNNSPSNCIDSQDKMTSFGKLENHCGIVNDKFYPDMSKTPISNATEKNGDEIDDDVESMLDTFYGPEWRKKQHLILPNSEPRKQNSVSVNKLLQTERKPKASLLYKNPYLKMDMENCAGLLTNLQKSRSASRVESPCLAKIKALCDPDTDSTNSTSPVKCREKLNFNDSTEEVSLEDNTSKYFRKKSTENANNKENIDISNLGLSLEERIKKKIHNIKDVPRRTWKKPAVPNKKLPVQDKKSTNNKKTVVIPKITRRGSTSSSSSSSNNSYIEDKKKKSTKIKIDSGPISSTDSNNSYTTDRKNKTTKSKTESDTISSSNSSNSYSEDEKKKSTKTKTVKKIKQKTTEANTKSSPVCVSSDDEIFDEKVKKIHRSSLANGTYSFLESLSASVPILRTDMSARIFRSNFAAHKDHLLVKLFKLYNQHIFDDAIPADTAMEWNDRMRGTAGFCYCKKITRRNGVIERSVRIVLSTKVIDSADRLRDTLVHEMCHAATWIVNCVSDGHGSYWKAWAYKAMKTFPELPPIKRCHDYVINTKYTYRCKGCSYSIGRHTKSLDVERKRCGYCLGEFEVLINKLTKKGETKVVPSTPRKANGFALFVKENYSTYKTANLKHGDVMKVLSRKFQELKVQKANDK